MERMERMETMVRTERTEKTTTTWWMVSAHVLAVLACAGSTDTCADSTHASQPARQRIRVTSVCGVVWGVC